MNLQNYTLECDNCGVSVDLSICFKEYEDKEIDICVDCIRQAVLLIEDRKD